MTESIAENTHRPLYALTCGELGTDPVETDQILRRIFIRAKSWNAILLLDEADVFLAKRERNDLQRNAFVSSMLLPLSYSTHPGNPKERMKRLCHCLLILLPY
ncbi:ATP-dependent Zn protease, partial [Enterocytozoon bieneusi H348]